MNKIRYLVFLKLSVLSCFISMPASAQINTDRPHRAECVTTEDRSSGNYSDWRLVNSCSEDINVFYCVENSNSRFDCAGDTYYAGSILPNSASFMPGYEKDGFGKLRIAACAFPEWPTRFKEPGQKYGCKGDGHSYEEWQEVIKRFKDGAQTSFADADNRAAEIQALRDELRRKKQREANELREAEALYNELMQKYRYPSVAAKPKPKPQQNYRQPTYREPKPANHRNCLVDNNIFDGSSCQLISCNRLVTCDAGHDIVTFKEAKARCPYAKVEYVDYVLKGFGEFAIRPCRNL